MATEEGVFPKLGGDPVYMSEINDIHSGLKQIYTGNGFDVPLGPDYIGSEMMNFIGSTSMAYLRVKVLGESYIVETSTGKVQLKVQTCESGGTLSDVISYVDIQNHYGISTAKIKIAPTFEVSHILTNAERASGTQVMIFAKGEKTGTGSISFTNKQTTIELF